MKVSTADFSKMETKNKELKMLFLDDSSPMHGQFGTDRYQSTSRSACRKARGKSQLCLRQAGKFLLLALL